MEEKYQVYLNGMCIADDVTIDEAMTIKNGRAMEGEIDIERI